MDSPACHRLRPGTGRATSLAVARAATHHLPLDPRPERSFARYGTGTGITSLLALFVSVVPGLSGTGDIPIGIVVILLLQVVGLAMMSRVEGNLWGPSWISVGFLVSVMLPMLAFQVSLLHEPYVSIGMGSADQRYSRRS